MKTITQQLSAFACLSSVFFFGVAIAETPQPQGGVIHFVGAIVEDPCNISTQSRHLAVSCYRDGQERISAISYQQALAGHVVRNEGADVSMRYLNQQKTLGIVTVSYR